MAQQDSHGSQSASFVQWPPQTKSIGNPSDVAGQVYGMTLNGQAVQLKALSPTQTLLQVLNQNGYLGSKEGCGDGDCGACTVSIAYVQSDGALGLARATNSCLVPIAAVAGMSITTVEGVASSAGLHPVQQAMLDHGGSQCGYCTPGFIMSLYASYEANEILDAHTIEGNLCRCTGYTSIRSSCHALNAHRPQAQRYTPNRPLNREFSAAQPVALGKAETQLLQGAASGYPGYYRPTTIAAAVALKAEHPDAQWLAGGTDLGLLFSRNPYFGAPLIALAEIAALQELRVDSGVDLGGSAADRSLRIGAMCTLSELKYFAESAGGLADNDPRRVLLTEMLHWFAARQVRNRATLGGNLGTASPIGDMLPVLLSLDAEIELQSPRGTRRVAIAQYFLGYRETQKAADELIVAIVLPSFAPVDQALGVAQRSACYKVGKRGSDDISIVAASFCVGLDAQQSIVRARLAYGGVAAVPRRAERVEAIMLGQKFSPTLLNSVLPTLQAEFQPLSDARGSAGYRQQLIVNLLRKFVDQHGVAP